MAKKLQDFQRAMISRRSLGYLVAAASSFAVPAVAEDEERAPRIADNVLIDQLLYRHSIALDDRDTVAFLGCYKKNALSQALAEKVITFHRGFAYTMHSIMHRAYDIDGDSARGTAFCVVTYVKVRSSRLKKFDVYSRYKDDRLIKEDGHWVFEGPRNWSVLFRTEETPVHVELPADFWSGWKE